MERLADAARRLRRVAEARRRLLLLLAAAAALLLWLAPPPLFRLLAAPPAPPARCLPERLAAWADARDRYDAALSTAPYVGNGLFGLVLEPDARLYIRSGRTLSLPLNFHPVVVVDDYGSDEASIVDYLAGTVHKYQCSPLGYEASYRYYAHRAVPNLFVQEIKISNPTNGEIDLNLTPVRVSDWPSLTKRTIELRRGDSLEKYDVHTGKTEASGEDDYVIVASIVSRIIPTALSLKSKDVVEYDSFTVIQYGDPVPKDKFEYERDIVEKLAIESMRRAIELSQNTDPDKSLRATHADVWRRLWYNGFSISESKAAEAINGDKINATIYAVLSQVRSYEYEEGISSLQKADILKALTYAEGCYEGHYTLQAQNLWKSLQNVRQINNVVRAWLLTLEKQGCHNLLRAGASGAMQAMVLSFGSLRFSNQHLEFNMHPSDLHRDFNFRRVNYGNLTHVNISVTVQEDNVAVLYVALDRSDRSYFACDGGCLDSPMVLGPARKFFPVKLTDPLTAILYITSDKRHMEDLRHAIHVKEVVVAPAHEHHVIALHKHGHSLGGLSTMFWVSVCLIIVVFHMFLCRIIMSEYCDPPDKYRRLYSKP